MSTGLQSLGVRSSQDRRMNFTNRIRRHVLGVLVAACCVAATNGCVVMQPDDDDGGTVNTSTSGAANTNGKSSGASCQSICSTGMQNCGANGTTQDECVASCQQQSFPQPTLDCVANVVSSCDQLALEACMDGGTSPPPSDQARSVVALTSAPGIRAHVRMGRAPNRGVALTAHASTPKLPARMLARSGQRKNMVAMKLIKNIHRDYAPDTAC